MLEAQRSTLHLVPTDQPPVSRAIPGAEAATLSPTTGGVALIRPDGTVTRATPSDNANLSVQTEQLSISATGWTAVQAAGQLPDRLLLLDPSGARLGSCPTSGDCTLISLAPYATPKDAFGTAQYATGVVFIPVHSTGQVILVDIATGTVRKPVPVIEQPAPFELTATADAVWFNNPTTNEAGKIAGDGTVTKILKYPDDLDASGVRALVANGAGPIGRNEGIGTGGGGGTGPGGGSDEGAVDSEAPNAPDQPQQNDPAATTTTTAPTSSPPTTAADSTSNPPVTATTTAGDSSEDRTPGTSPPAPKPGEPSPPPGSPSTPDPAPETKPTPDPTDSTRAPDPAAPPKPSPNQTTDGKPKEEQPTPSDALEAKMALGSTSVEPNTDLQLRDISTGNPDSRLWSFGDGSTATDVAPRHRWTRPGTYTITLTIKKGAEERSTRQTIQVTAELVASFSAPATARVGDSVAFINTSSGDIASYRWRFGDGSAESSSSEPTHRFSAIGEYTVELIVTAADNSSARAARRVTVTASNRPPTITGASVTLAAGSSRTLSAGELGVVDPDGDQVTLSVRPGGSLPAGTTARLEGGAITVNAGSMSGTGTATIDATDTSGAIRSGQLTVTVNAAPQGTVPGAPTLNVYSPRYNSFAVHVVPRSDEPTAVTKYVFQVVETGKEYASSTSIRVYANDLPKYTSVTLIGYVENANGRSGPSAPLTVPRVLGDPPPTPTGLRATAAGSTVSVRWNPVNVEAGAAPVEYVVRRAPGSPADEIRVQGSDATLNLPNGTYEISVLASSADGDSTPASTSVDVLALSAPANVRATVPYPDFRNLLITWDPAPGADSYTVTRTQDGQLATIASSVTSTQVVDSTLSAVAPGISHTYTVTARFAGADGPVSTPSNACRKNNPPTGTGGYEMCDGQTPPTASPGTMSADTLSATGGTFTLSGPTFEYMRLVGLDCRVQTSGERLSDWFSNKRSVPANEPYALPFSVTWAVPSGTAVECRTAVDNIAGSLVTTAFGSWTVFVVP
ncbi:MAG: PKD domain-containing protein [Acidimicrobiia bacterium]